MNNQETDICPRHRAISLLLSNDPSLLNLIFDGTERKNIPFKSRHISDLTTGMSDGQKILIKISLDIWNSSKNSRLEDIIFVLDDVRFEAFILAITSLRSFR